MKKMIKISGLVLLDLVGIFVFGLLMLWLSSGIGATYFQSFRMFGVQGYEATGLLGFLIGILAGIIVSLFLWRKNLRKLFLKKN